MAGQFLGIDIAKLPREERYSDATGQGIYCKEFLIDPDTGMLVRLVR